MPSRYELLRFVVLFISRDFLSVLALFLDFSSTSLSLPLIPGCSSFFLFLAGQLISPGHIIPINDFPLSAIDSFLWRYPLTPSVYRHYPSLIPLVSSAHHSSLPSVSNESDKVLLRRECYDGSIHLRPLAPILYVMMRMLSRIKSTTFGATLPLKGRKYMPVLLKSDEVNTNLYYYTVPQMLTPSQSSVDLVRS